MNLAGIKKYFRLEDGYFKISGNPILYFLKQGNYFSHFIDRIKFRVFPRLHIVPRFPTHLDIESASNCQMKCPMCYTTYMEASKKGTMKYDLFTKIVDQALEGGVYSVKISWRGEPLLNKRIVDMVKYAKQSGIKEVAMLTNGERLTSKMAEELVDCGLDWISFSVDGQGEIYETIRAPAKFPETVEKITYLRKYREQKQKIKPLIRVQSIYSAIKDDPDAYIKVWDGIADRVNCIADESRDFELKEMMHDSEYNCPTPWARMTIGYDGRVHQCKVDYDRKQTMGDTNHQSLFDIWHGEAFSRLRKVFREHAALENFEACNLCSDNVVTEEKVIKAGGKLITSTLRKGIADLVENGQVVPQSVRRERTKDIVANKQSDESVG